MLFTMDPYFSYTKLMEFANISELDVLPSQKVLQESYKKNVWSVLLGICFYFTGSNINPTKGILYEEVWVVIGFPLTYWK